MPITANNIKSELSYAVLHAIASRAGYSCRITTRHEDDMGIDAQVCVKEDFGPDATFTELKLDFQLKATATVRPVVNGKVSFPLEADHYDKLRTSRIDVPRYLALFLMPEDDTMWLEKSVAQFICRNCLRWVSLRNAPQGNPTSTTIYVPEAQLLTVDALRGLAAKRSREEWIDYAG